VRVVRWRPWLGAALAYVAITLAFVSPLTNYAHLSEASYEGDARLLIWTLAWDAHAWLSAAPLFDANIFYPAPDALSHAEHHVGIAAFALPFYAATGSAVLAYWIVWLLAFPLNALAMHALAWRVTRDHRASFVGGIIYAFCFFRMHHAHGHIQLIWTWPLPLVPLALERWLAQPTWSRVSVVTALVLVQALSTWYLAVFVGLLAAVVTVALLPGTKLRRAHVVQAGAALACAGIAIAWFAAPYVRLVPGPVEEAAGNAADLKAYLVPPENTWLGQWLLRSTSIAPRWIWGEQTLYTGIITIALACTGAWRMRSGPLGGVTAAVLLTGLLALGLSFGPSATGVSPFDLFSMIPGMSLLRAPARFALLVMMALALLASIASASVTRRGTQRRLGIVVVLVAGILAESFVVKFPSGRPQPFRTPRIYEHLASLPGGAVLSLPTYRGTPEAFRETDYLLFSTDHWRPLVNGFGRQEPPAHGARMDVLVRFPDRDAVQLMRELDIRYAVLHTRRDSGLLERVTRAGASSGVRLIASASGDFLFEIGR
jgi:cbb3-type cytochrome oxidase subunit 3